MKVVLLGMEFFINNLGCEALSYSFTNELYEIAKQQEKNLELVTVVFADQKTPYIIGTKRAIKCIGIHYKSPSFWKTLKKEFRSSDLIVDLTMGDSFSDIYGMKRFILDALVKTKAVKSGTPFILGPQTYGPYNNFLIRKWAKWIMRQSIKIYARDEKSQKLAQNLSKKEVILTTDVAFSLPYDKQRVGSTEKIKVGFNPSGLLWCGGYTHNNQFGLILDYQKFCWDICEKLNQDTRYEVFLIPHVGTIADKTTLDENDLYVCQQIQMKYPNMNIINDIHSPMDIKGYLAAMDVFIGARMHATIGAFSSGVATIPVSYSRKFEGLYGSLDYHYVIQATQVSTEEAVSKTLEYILNYEKLKADIDKSMQIVNQKQNIFRKSLAEIIKEL